VTDPRPRILVGATYNAQRRPYNNILYEFCSVIASSDDAEIIAPGPLIHSGPGANALGKGLYELHRTASRLTQMAGLRRLPSIRPVTISGEYDLFFYVCPFLPDLADCRQFRGWRRHCRRGAVFLLESWSSLLQHHKAHLALLDDFDHVFVLIRSSIPNVQRFTRAPCSFLPTGADCLRASPYPSPPSRVVDVYSMGRRAPTPHEQLVELARTDGLFYVFDALMDGTVRDWAESRALTSGIIKRSRYFMAHDHSVGSTGKTMEAAGEWSISTRYFEGAAGGAVMLGSAPLCPEFSECFDWPDAVIPVPSEGLDFREILRDLDSQAARMTQARRTNAIQSLRRHDWCYRWAEILRVMKLTEAPKLTSRRATLAALADAA
jgi:hypothetical protein